MKKIQILNNRAHWIFTLDQLPEWNPDHIQVVDYPTTGYQPVEGDLYDGDTGTFSAAPPDVGPSPATPQQCTRRQGRLALVEASDEVNMLVEVEAAIAAIADPIERLKAQVEYEADTWERDNAFLQSMWAALGGTESQLDDLFLLASTK